jgi:hypothetical protein
MRTRKLLACAAALALPFGATALPAEAQPTSHATYSEPKVAWVKKVHAVGGEATVLAKYRCSGGQGPNVHLWVSLKQGGDINKYSAKKLANMQGTSALARSWYDTNVVDPSTVTLTCNGKWQVQRYTLGREKGTLVKGRAFLQFCLFDSTSDPTGEDLSHGFAYKYKFVHVKSHNTVSAT